MSVAVVLPSQLRSLAGGRGRVELDLRVQGDRLPTVAEALEALRGAHPAVYERIIDERRELRRHVNVFVGREDIRWSGGFQTPVPPGAELVVLPSVSGG